MFKLFKKQKNNKQKAKPTKNDGCPMCKVPPEVVEELKRENNNRHKHKPGGCCG